MSEQNQGTEGFFDEAGREGAPSAELKQPGDFVHGEIVDYFKMPDVPVGAKEPTKNDDGSTRYKLVVVLQTKSRNWDKVVKVPENNAGVARPAAEDTGRRAVYISKFTNLYAAFGKALKAAGANDIAIGGTLGVKVTGLEDVGQPSKKKLHEAKYVAPEKGSDFGFDDDSSKSTSVDDDKQPGTSADTKPAAEVEEPPF